MENVLAFLSIETVAILILIIINIFLFLKTKESNKKIDILLEKGNIKDLRDVLFSQIEKTKEIETRLNLALEKIGTLEKTAERTFQKIGIIRFNAFINKSGNQSFAVALLDNQHTGFIISSLFVNDISRVYIKTMTKGKSDYLLSNEEKEAIERAIKS